MRSFCREKEVWDLFTSCEVMLENMDRVFPPPNAFAGFVF